MNRELNMSPVRLSAIVHDLDCELLGDDKKITIFGNLSTKTEFPEMQLSYVTELRFLEQFNTSKIGACIIHESLKKHIISDKSYIVTNQSPEDLFYIIFMNSINNNAYSKVSSYMGENNKISDKAIIHDSVIIGNDCTIMDNVVLMSNTIIGDRVVIKPNTVIGGDGFQVKSINGILKIIPHQGGVIIQSNAEIGSNVTIDKGLFGEFTVIQSEVKVDNLVHLAHSVNIGEKTIIAAGVIIAGGVSVGKSVWIGIKTSINQLIEISDYSFIGAGTVVGKRINSHEKVFGIPARRIGYMCVCRNDLMLNPDNETWVCPKCKTNYKF